MKSLFTKDQAVALGVKLIGVGGGILVSKGYLTGDQVTSLQGAWPELVGGVMVLYTVGYSLWANRKQVQIAKVAAMAEVTQPVVVSPDMAAKVAKVAPNASVVPAGSTVAG